MAHPEVSVWRIMDAMMADILENATTATIDGSFYKEIGQYVDPEITSVPSIFDMARQGVKGPGSEVLDFGCGTGRYRDGLTQMGYRWTGVNFKAGMASKAAETAEDDNSIIFYDGVELPFESDRFDAVYSLQVFEHLQKPDESFAEIARVMKPGARLVGSVSYMEQIHDYSTFNFTPYGFKMTVERAGLKLIRIYPQNDVFSILMRRLLIVTSGSNDTSLTGKYAAGSDFQAQIVKMGMRLKLPVDRINLLRLMFCSNFSFLVEK